MTQATVSIPRKRRPRYYRAAVPLPVKITPRREEVLKWFLQYTYLDDDQLARLMALSPRRARQFLTDLKHGGDHKRFYLRATKDNSTYVLDYGGREYLEKLGLDVPSRPRPDELADKQLAFLRHIRDVNSLLILGEILTREQPVKLARVLSDRDLHKIPIKVKVHGEAVTVIPDAFIDFDLSDGYEHAVAFEIDRGTSGVKAIHAKIHAYLEAIASKQYQQVLQANSLTIAFIVTDGGLTSVEKRVYKLCSWIQNVLVEEKKERYLDLFRVTGFNPYTISPSEAFFAPIWFRPDTKIVRLLGD